MWYVCTVKEQCRTDEYTTRVCITYIPGEDSRTVNSPVLAVILYTQNTIRQTNYQKEYSPPGLRSFIIWSTVEHALHHFQLYQY